MAEKNLMISELLDIYGALLTEKQFKLTSLYYEQDLSLGEIAENEGISRQGARDVIKRSEAQLIEYENALHIMRDEKKQTELLNSILTVCEKDDNNEHIKCIVNLINDYER